MSLPDKKMSAPPAGTGETLASPEDTFREVSLDMSIPTSDEGARANTPESAIAAQSVSPWAEFDEDPTMRPPQWTDPDTGQPFSSYSPDLFAAPTDLGIRSTGWTDIQSLSFLSHLGRDAFQACYDRDFSKAWMKDPETGGSIPRYLPVGTPALRRCQYAVLTHPQRTACLVLDIDRPSHRSGGQTTELHPQVFAGLNKLAFAGLGPAWVGINPLSGKCQVIWLIDPVYAAAGRTSSNMRLLAVATSELNAYLGGDQAFAHRFSRWPLHSSSDPTAYRWHCQHNQIVRLRDLITEVRQMSAQKPAERSERAEQFTSGRERIQAAQDATRAAQALRELDADLPNAAEIAPAASGVIDGVRIIWVSEGRAARDETAFRHALATAHRMKQASEVLKDAKIIDAYERGYQIAQAIGADHREADMPPMRDRLTMARRVRGYVTAGVTDPGNRSTSRTRMTSSGRKALATLGARGGKKAAQRWDDPESTEYQETARAPLASANEARSYNTDEHKGQIMALVARHRRQGLAIPSTKEIAAELGIGPRRVQQLRKELGITAKRGRPSSPKKSERP